MIKKFLLILVMSLFSACSFKTAPNQWQYRSTNAFSSYTQNFLSSKDIAAKNDFRRAVNHAKVSADLSSLAKIYLGKCALNISVGIEDHCLKYRNISPTLESKSLKNYYNFLTLNIESQDLDLLPVQYQDFAKNLLNADYVKANQEIRNIEKITSKMLAGALLKEHIQEESIKDIIKDASLHGYKKSVLYWLKRLKQVSKDTKQIAIINKKIEVINE
jgi:hypothetical protein